MKIIYMGTPDFAVRPLEALIEAGFDVELAVTKADKPAGRGGKLQACPLKIRAQELGIDVASPEKIKKNEEFFGLLKALEPDFIVVAAYGKILPKEILELPKYGCINIHGSILPKYRGAAPIQRAVLNGETETGVTIMYMAEDLDSGDIISTAETEVGRKTSGKLFDELSELGAKLLVDTLPKIADGTARRVRQNEDLATYAAMISKEEGRMDFSLGARQLDCLVRGMSPAPGAYAYLGDVQMKVREAVPADAEETAAAADAFEGTPSAGTVLRADKRGLLVSCGKGEGLLITKLQMPGKKAMDVQAFLLGNKIEIGTVIG